MIRYSLFSVLLGGFLLALTPNSCKSEPFIEILDVKAKGDQVFLSAEVAIHDRSFIDINITVHQDFVGHSLFVSIHLKRSVQNQWATIKRWKNIDLCSFLSGEKSDILLSYIFDQALNDRAMLLCPFPVGFYPVENIYLDATRMPPMIPKSSKYRLFFEISQTMGESAKILSLKVDAAYRE